MAKSKNAAGQKRVCMLLLNDLLNPVDPRVYKEAKSLIKGGYEVHVVCWTRRYKPTVMKEVSEGIHVHRIVYDPGPINASIIHKVKVFSHVRRLIAEYVLQLNPDIIHAHDLEALPIGARVKKVLRIPLVFDSHEYWPALEARKSMILGLMTRILQRWHIGSADAILTIGEGVAERLTGTKVEKIILYNSRAMSEIEGLQSRIEKETLGINKEDFVVGYFGRIDHDLGYDIALKAMKTLKKNGVRLLVVGGPEEMKNHYEQLARDYNVLDACVFTGRVPYTSVYSYLSITDVGLLLYESNPLYDISAGNRLFDYMGAGVPIICSNLSGTRQIIEHAGCGLILEKRDADSLVDAIMKLKRTPDLAKNLRENALTSFRNEFCWEKQEEKLLSLYAKL